MWWKKARSWCYRLVNVHSLRNRNSLCMKDPKVLNCWRSSRHTVSLIIIVHCMDASNPKSTSRYRLSVSVNFNLKCDERQSMKLWNLVPWVRKRRCWPAMFIISFIWIFAIAALSTLIFPVWDRFWVQISF